MSNTITPAPQLVKVQAVVTASQEKARAELIEVSAKLAEEGVRFAESRGRDIMRITGFLAGMREIEWALTDAAESTEPLAVIVADLLLELGGIQAATAEGVNLPQRSPDFIGGKVSAVRSISRRLVDTLRDSIRDNR